MVKRTAGRRQPKAAAIYARISHDPRGEALGVQRQETLCRELAESKNWPVAETFVDNDISAFNGKPRPAFQRMLEAIRAGAVDAVICVDLDRLVRRPSELEGFITLADEYRVALANVSGDVDLSTSDGRFRARILGSVASMESEKKSERLKRQRDQAAQQGRAHGGTRPFGFEADHETHRKAEVRLIREAARRVAAGEPMRSVCRDWGARGIRTTLGNAWGVPSLREMLTNPRLVGMRRHRPLDRNGRPESEAVYPATWKPILDRDTWESVCAIVRTHSKPSYNGPGRPPSHLLSGIVRCGLCDRPMWITWSTSGGRRLYRYGCIKAPGRRGCGRIAVVAAHVDELVSEMVLYALSGPALTKALEGRDDDETAGVADELARLEDKLSETAAMFAADEISRNEWVVVRDKLEERISKLRRTWEDATSTSTLTSLPSGEDALRTWWTEASIEQRRAVVEAVVERITVQPAKRGGGRFDPERVEIVWRA